MEYPQLHRAFLGLGLSPAQVYAHLKDFTVTVLDGYARNQGKVRWIDKTPNYYNYLDFIDELFAKDVCYLFITRHPFDTIQSLEGIGQGSGRGHYAFDDPELGRHARANGVGRFSWAKYWRDVNERLLTFSSGHPERCKLFRYEDLVRDSETTLREVLEFIGERFSPNMIEHAFTNDPKAMKGFGDSKIRRTSGIHSASIGKWQDWPHAECDALWRVTGETATLFGYAKDVETMI
jgi:hypothetical protein